MRQRSVWFTSLHCLNWYIGIHCQATAPILITKQNQIYYEEWINGWKTYKNSTYSTISVLWKTVSFILPSRNLPVSRSGRMIVGDEIGGILKQQLAYWRYCPIIFPKVLGVKPWKTSRLPPSGWESNPGLHGYEAAIHTTRPWFLELFHNLNLSV